SARLLDQLINDGLLVAQREVTPPFKVGREVATVLELDRIPFVSYPYEWSFSQLQDAALLTLALQSRAIEQDFWLKDASAYNVQFIGAQPIFIDTLSFEPLSLQPWVAYRQFCQHFLAPLALMAKVDIRLQQLLRTNIDGIPLDVAANLLPRRTKLSPSLLIHLHLHAGSQKRHAADGAKQQRPKLPDGQFSKQSLLGLVNSLTSAVQGLH